MTLDEAVKKVRPLDEKAMEGARKRWDSIAKPLHSLGELENMLTQIAGITGTPEVRVEKKAVVAMCADNGVVEEGVTQTGQEVTAVVAENFLEGTTTCCVMCRQCGAELFPVDVGMVTDTKVRTDLKVAYGTRNMTREPAMTRDQAIRGIEAGIAMAEAEVTMIPQTYVTLTDEADITNIGRILDFLDDDDDVQEVYHNWEE